MSVAVFSQQYWSVNTTPPQPSRSLSPSHIKSFSFYLLFYIQLFHWASFVHHLALLPLLKFTANAPLLQYCGLSFSKSLTPPLDHSLVICSEEEGEEERCREEEHTSRVTLLQHTQGSLHHNSLHRESLRHLRLVHLHRKVIHNPHALSSALLLLAWLSSLRPQINQSSLTLCPLTGGGAQFSVLHRRMGFKKKIGT